MSITQEQFEARQLTALGIGPAEYARDFITTQDSVGFFKTVPRADLETHEQARRDDEERKQFEADMQAEVEAEMRLREASR
jgi:hypothetical protein